MLLRVTKANLFLIRDISILAINDVEKAGRCVREQVGTAHPDDVTSASTSHVRVILRGIYSNDHNTSTSYSEVRNKMERFFTTFPVY